VNLDFPSVHAALAEWEGCRVSVAVDRERIKTGFKPMAVLQGVLGGVEAVPEVGQGPGIQNVPNADLPPEQRTHALFYPVGDGACDGLHGRPGFYLSLPEFDHASVSTPGLLTITGRDLEIQVQLLNEEKLDE
jgi:hypothetical protein